MHKFRNNSEHIKQTLRAKVEKWRVNAETDMTARRAMGVRRAHRLGSSVIMQKLRQVNVLMLAKRLQASHVTPLYAYFSEKSRDMISLPSAPPLYVVPHIVSK